MAEICSAANFTDFDCDLNIMRFQHVKILPKKFDGTHTKIRSEIFRDDNLIDIKRYKPWHSVVSAYPVSSFLPEMLCLRKCFAVSVNKIRKNRKWRLA